MHQCESHQHDTELLEKIIAATAGRQRIHEINFCTIQGYNLMPWAHQPPKAVASIFFLLVSQ